MDSEWLSALDDAGDVGRRHNVSLVDFELQLPFDDVFPAPAHSRLRCLDAKHPSVCDTCVRLSSAGGSRLGPLALPLAPRVHTRPHSTRASTQVHASA